MSPLEYDKLLIIISLLLCHNSKCKDKGLRKGKLVVRRGRKAKDLYFFKRKGDSRVTEKPSTRCECTFGEVF
jgi:hypothetical protein